VVLFFWAFFPLALRTPGIDAKLYDPYFFPTAAEFTAILQVPYPPLPAPLPTAVRVIPHHALGPGPVLPNRPRGYLNGAHVRLPSGGGGGGVQNLL